MNPPHFLFVFAGGALGSLARVLVAWPFIAGVGPVWAGTLFANGLGALAMGICAARLGHRRITRAWHFWVTGALGGFTTFSLFSLEALVLWLEVSVPVAVAYVLGSAAVWLICLLAGWKLAVRFDDTKVHA